MKTVLSRRWLEAILFGRVAAPKPALDGLVGEIGLRLWRAGSGGIVLFLAVMGLTLLKELIPESRFWSVPPLVLLGSESRLL